MNAGKRWAYHFVAGLECVKCRRKGGLTLYSFRDRIQKVDSESLTPWALRDMVPVLDVWCSDCVPRITTRVTSQGRSDHKEEAARMADIRVGIQRASNFDTYRLHNVDISRTELLERLKRRPCAQCGGTYPVVVMEMIHPVKRLSSVRDILDNAEESIIVCGNCKKLIESKIVPFPRSNIQLDENFWSSLDDHIE